MPDKRIVFYDNTFAYKRMALDLAVFAYDCVLLYLYKGSDFGIIADGASVEVDKPGYLYVFPQGNIVGNALVIFFSIHHYTSTYLLIRKRSREDSKLRTE